jgi:hypothetical protein
MLTKMDLSEALKASPPDACDWFVKQEKLAPPDALPL